MGLSLNELCFAKLRQNASSMNGYSEVITLAKSIVGEHFIGCILFGSYARQRTHTYSDVDIMIVVNSDFQTSRQHIRQWDEAQLVIDGKQTSASFVKIPTEHTPQNILWYEVAVDGQILADPTGIIQKKLSELRNAIADKKIMRRYSHGQPYWVKE